MIILDRETYAQIDIAYEMVTIHKGQRQGLDSDWGGQVIASIALEHALKIAQALHEEDEEWLVAMLRKYEEGNEARADAGSAHWGHD